MSQWSSPKKRKNKQSTWRDTLSNYKSQINKQCNFGAPRRADTSPGSFIPGKLIQLPPSSSSLLSVLRRQRKQIICGLSFQPPCWLRLPSSPARRRITPPITGTTGRKQLFHGCYSLTCWHQSALLSFTFPFSVVRTANNMLGNLQSSSYWPRYKLSVTLKSCDKWNFGKVQVNYTKSSN